MDESATAPRGNTGGAGVAVRPVGGRQQRLRRRMATAATTPPPNNDDVPETTAQPVAEAVATPDVETPAAVDEASAALPADDTAALPAEDTAAVATDEVESPEPPESRDTPARRRKWRVGRRASVPAPVASPEPDEPDAVALTEAQPASPEEAPASTTSSAQASDEAADPVVHEAVDTTTDAADSAVTAGDEPKLRERRPLRRWHVAVAASAAALFVGSSAFTGAMLQPYLADRAVVDIKMDIARTAANAITTFWTYTPADMDQLPARAAPYLGGNLKENFLKQVDAFVAASKQYQVTRNAEVVGAAVESLNGPDATALVYANIVYTSSATKGVPTFNLTTFRLQMHRDSDGWVITSMPTVTSKDASQVVG